MQIRQIPAKDLVGGVFQVLRDAGFADEACNWNIQTDAPGIGYSVNGPSLNAFLQQPPVQALVGVINENDFITCTTFHVHTAQGQQVLQFQVQPEGLVGTFTVGNPGRQDRMLAVLKGLRTRFNVFSHAVLLDKTQKEFMSAGLKQQEVAIASLEAQARRLQEFMEKSAKEERERIATFRAEVEKELLTRRADLDKEHEARKSTFEEQQSSAEAALKKRQEEFDQKVKEFETQEAKFVRRKLLKEFEEAVSKGQTPQLSAATEKKRWGVHFVIWTIEVLAGSVLAASVYRLVTGQTYDWHIAIPLTASFGTMISTLVYYLRWLDRRYREHADIEFMSSRYKADMLRASWVAELTAEMHTLGEGATIPPQLLEALTRSLFKAKVDGPSEHPLEQILSMLGRGTEAKLDPNGLLLKAAEPKK